MVASAWLAFVRRNKHAGNIIVLPTVYTEKELLWCQSIKTPSPNKIDTFGDYQEGCWLGLISEQVF